MSERVWCRCGDPLPPKTEKFGRDWICSVCGGERRYHEKLSVQRGGIVQRCGECLYEARKKGESVNPTLCRAVTCTTQMAGEFRDRNTYYMCDPCIDAEIVRQTTADITDGRETRERARVGQPGHQPITEESSMSWGKSVSGKGAELREKAAAWPDEVKASDESWATTDALKQSHAAQVDIAHRALDVLGNVYPDREISVSVSGHANDDGTGYVNVNYTFTPEAPAE